MAYKFAFVAACFGVALASYFFCRSRKDWLWLVLGLAFTVAADYFLVLHGLHYIGVAVFCFAHVAYIVRAVNASPGGLRRVLPVLAVIVAALAYFVLALCVLSWLNRIHSSSRVFVIIFSVETVAIVYALLFITNIYVSARYIRHNRVLVIAGLLLFAACDICVLLFNLPFYFGAPGWLRGVFPLIWVFYLPSQALLAVSAVDFTRFHCQRRNSHIS